MFSSLKRLATAIIAIAVMLVSAPSFAQSIYQPRIEGGVKVMASDDVQLVDLEQGRSFMRFLASASGNLPGDKPRTTDAKL